MNIELRKIIIVTLTELEAYHLKEFINKHIPLKNDRETIDKTAYNIAEDIHDFIK